MAKILLTVSISVSPFLTDDDAAEKLSVSAERRFSANSKDNLVRVEFSKNKFAIVISRKDGTFRIGRLITSLKLSAEDVQVALLIGHINKDGNIALMLVMIHTFGLLHHFLVLQIHILQMLLLMILLRLRSSVREAVLLWRVLK